MAKIGVRILLEQQFDPLTQITEPTVAATEKKLSIFNVTQISSKPVSENYRLSCTTDTTFPVIFS